MPRSGSGKVETHVLTHTHAGSAIHARLDYSVALSSDKVQTFMGRTRMPVLSLHGIEGAFAGPGAETAIPAKPRPLTNTRQRGAFVTRYLESEFAKLGSENTTQIELLHSSKPWVADWKHWNYAAAMKATESIYARSPDPTREGGSIPVTLTFAEQLGVNVLLLPVGRGDDGAQ
ncbi:hypothetical protein C8R45DRAFT_1103531 [Mycena sanguinolenta]|nr:hypothetical protein C8R45DRAFT_1103531 [Mycena sanguinolenta]